MTDTTTIQTLSVPNAPDELALQLATRTERLTTYLGYLVESTNDQNTLALADSIKSELSFMSAEVAVGMQMLSTAAQAITLIIQQRDEAIQERDDLQSYVDENGDFMHMEECPECLDEFIAEQIENDRQEKEEDQQHIIQQLSTKGNDQGSQLLAQKLEEAQTIQAEADAMLEEAEKWLNETIHAEWKERQTANAVLYSDRENDLSEWEPEDDEDLEDEDDDDTEYEDETEI